MEKLFKNALAALLIVLVALTGCSKAGSNDPRVPLPDISDFTILNATPFAAGTTSSVNIYCTSIGAGTYKVYFDLGGSNTLTSQSATLIMYDGYGTFKTPVLPNPGETFLTLVSITNINGGGTTFISNNKYTISDSTGLMTGIIGGTTTFRATDVLATITGYKLTIRGVVAEPYNATMTLTVDSFTHANGIINFSSYNVPEKASAQYQVHGGGIISANGVINILSVQPTLTGTYSFTGMDSTKITSGSFSAATP